jgi:hypothetical protein
MTATWIWTKTVTWTRPPLLLNDMRRPLNVHEEQWESYPMHLPLLLWMSMLMFISLLVTLRVALSGEMALALKTASSRSSRMMILRWVLRLELLVPSTREVL